MRIVSQPVGVPGPIGQRAEAWNRRLDDALVAPSTAVLQRLAAPGTLVVTTGQQPGLFGGPLYTVHKAVAAAALARTLSQQWQRDVVPLFWLAGDDHDFAEASTAAWLDDGGRLQRWALPARGADRPQLPMSREVLGAEIEAGIDLFARTVPAVDLDWIRRWWRPGETIHGAFAGAMSELLTPLGIGCIDPTRDAFKRAQVPMLAEALRRSAELDRALAAGGDAGTGITAGEGASLVFIETDAGRERLVADGDGFRSRGSSVHFSLGDLERMLESEPARFSANVLLRPVVESALLPTVAYVAGPGELRYLERQAALLYPLLDVPRQQPVGRWGGYVVEAWADRILRKLGLTPEEVIDDDGALGRSILRRDVPPAVRDAIERLREVMASSGDALVGAGRVIDPVLDRAVDGRMRRAALIVNDVERVIERHLRRRDDIAHAQYRRVRTLLMPGDAPQERVLSVAGVHARHGRAWLDAASSAAEAWAADRLEVAAAAR